MSTVRNFLHGNLHNSWIAAPGIRIYVRKGERYHGDKRVRTLDIANVEVYGKQGVGVFTRWYESAVDACHGAGVEYVYIESIMSEVVIGFCKRRGFELAHDGLAPSYIKKI